MQTTPTKIALPDPTASRLVYLPDKQTRVTREQAELDGYEIVTPEVAAERQRKAEAANVTPPQESPPAAAAPAPTPIREVEVADAVPKPKPGERARYHATLSFACVLPDGRATTITEAIATGWKIDGERARSPYAAAKSLGLEGESAHAHAEAFGAATKLLGETSDRRRALAIHALPEADGRPLAAAMLAAAGFGVELAAAFLRGLPREDEPDGSEILIYGRSAASDINPRALSLFKLRLRAKGDHQTLADLDYAEQVARSGVRWSEALKMVGLDPSLIKRGLN